MPIQDVKSNVVPVLVGEFGADVHTLLTYVVDLMVEDNLVDDDQMICHVAFASA